MDHHCPWVANCVGFYNYKFFLNMLFHTAMTTLVVLTTSYPIVPAVLASEKTNQMVAYYIMTSYILDVALCKGIYDN